MKKYLIILALAACQISLFAQDMFVDKGLLILDQGGTLIIKGGGISSNRNIVSLEGGKIILKAFADGNDPNVTGLEPNTINMNLPGGSGVRPYYIYNLEIDNPNGARLLGNTGILDSITFKRGSLFLEGFNLTLQNGAKVRGYAADRGIVAEGAGFCEYKLSSSNLGEQFLFPLSNRLVSTSNYPVTRTSPIALKNIGGTLSTGTPMLRAQARLFRSPNAPIRTESYTKVHWPIRVSGISNGTLSGRGYYGYSATNTPAEFFGNESEIVGFGFNNVDWMLTGSSQNHTDNFVDGTINTTFGEIFGMNKFVYLKAKALLQGAYAGGGLMNDNLRSGTTGGNLIPVSDPYRTPDYTGAFTHVNNPTAELAKPSVFYNQPNVNDNIVDWVFVEARTAVSTNPILLQTRSALIQKDGDIVDIDGKSPLYFKNLNEGNYTITIRHRNHLAMSTNYVGNQYAVMSTFPFLSNFDFTTANPNMLLGTGGATNNSNYLVSGGYKKLYGGNVNGGFGSNRISYSGSDNDVAAILGGALVGSPGKILGNISGVYHFADVNMDRRVSYSGSNNDPAFVLSQSLAGFPSGRRTELRPQ